MKQKYKYERSDDAKKTKLKPSITSDVKVNILLNYSNLLATKWPSGEKQIHRLNIFSCQRYFDLA